MVILSVQLLSPKCGLSENLPSTLMYHPTKSVQILPRKCGLPAALASTPAGEGVGGSGKCGQRPQNLSENLPSTSMYHPTKFHIDPSISLGGVR